MELNAELIILLVGALLATAEALRRVIVKRYEARTKAMLVQQKADIEKGMEVERARIRQKEKELDAKLLSQRDEREFRQETEKQLLDFQKLQASWGADGTMELLRHTIEFIETTIIDQNKEILKELNKFTQTIARNSDGVERIARDNHAAVRLLAGSIDKLRESLGTGHRNG